jgi:hypothetical protein
MRVATSTRTALRHVGKRGVDTALRSDRVRARRKHLGDARRVQAASDQTRGSTQTSATSAKHHSVELVVVHLVARQLRGGDVTRGLAVKVAAH